MTPTLTATDLESLSAAYVGMLESEGMPFPLAQPITAAAVLADLFALAGQPVPAFITTALDSAALGL